MSLNFLNVRVTGYAIRGRKHQSSETHCSLGCVGMLPDGFFLNLRHHSVLLVGGGGELFPLCCMKPCRSHEAFPGLLHTRIMSKTAYHNTQFN